jgi:HAD superfamily hydrolase (TIGR01484 family)
MTTLVIAFDLDGTLIKPDKTIHPRDIEILNTMDGPVFVPVTARTKDSIKKVLRSYGLFTETAVPLPMVCQYGSVILGPNENLLHSICFDAETTDALLERMRSFPEVSFWLYTPDHVFAMHQDEHGDETGKEFDFTIFPYDNTPVSLFTKASAVSRDSVAVQEFCDAIKDLNLDASHYRPSILEICPPGVDKGTGLRHLIQDIGLDGCTVLSAGDTSYDLPMFGASKHSFVPQTAEESISRQATHVIDVNPEGLFVPMLRSVGYNL